MLLRLQLRMMLVGSVILLCWLGYLAAITAKDVYSLRDRESAVRGLVVAESLAHSIGRALGYGIEMDDLTGIDQVFAARMADNRDVVEIVFDDANGRVRVPLAPPLRQGVPVSAVVTVGDHAMGKVTVYLRHTSLLGAIGAPFSRAVLILLVVFVAAGEAVRYCVGRGPGLRDATAKGLLGQISELDLDRVVKEVHLKRLDLRSAWLSTQIRDLNERFMRLFRLIVSLRHTEPSNAERTRLLALANQARGATKFALAKPTVKRPLPTGVDMRWLVFVATASLSVNLFWMDRMHGGSLVPGPLLLGLGLFAAWCGYEMVQRWLKSRPARAVCLSGLFLLGATPLVFLLVSLLGSEGMQASGTAAAGGIRDLGPFIAVCMQALGTGVFFGGLSRFTGDTDPAAVGSDALHIVVLKAVAVVGAPAVLIWGSILGRNAMLLLSSALAVGAYVFFAISAFAHRAPSTENTPPGRVNASAGTAVCAGFVLYTVIAAVTNGNLPGVPTTTPELLAWSLLAMGMGFTAQFLPTRWSATQDGLIALLACAVLLMGPWYVPQIGAITSLVALMVLTACLIRLLREPVFSTSGVSQTPFVLGVVWGGVGASLLFSMCLYLGYAASTVWGLAAAGCLALVMRRALPTAKATHAA